jgi:capsular exopolysaccharide synthesis family protein
MERSTELFHPFFDEQLTKLHVRIQALQSKQDIHIIQVASVHRGEGTTMTVFQLAQKAARFHQRILLIDLNPGHAKQAEASILHQRGLTDSILGGTNWMTCIQSVEPSIDVLPYGDRQQRPERLFAQDKWTTSLAEWKREYDLILIDAPPLSEGTLSRHITRLADASLLVVASGQTRRQDIEQAVQALRQQGATLLGAILTQVKMDEMPYYNRYRSVTIEFAE